jgi:hypothetical protein
MSWTTARPTNRPAHGPASPAPTTDSNSGLTWTTPCPGNSPKDDLADLVWEVLDDFTAEHASVGLAAIRAHQAGNLGEGEQLWQQTQALWSRAWSANYQTMELMQASGLTRFSLVKPQRWVIASFEHHCGPHGLPHPHIRNIVITALTTGSGRDHG